MGDKGSQIACIKHTGQTTGVYDVTWTTTHPDGAYWIGTISGEGSSHSGTLGAGSAGYTNTSIGLTCVFGKLYS
jgi:hypothetical protein